MTENNSEDEQLDKGDYYIDTKPSEMIKMMDVKVVTRNQERLKI